MLPVPWRGDIGPRFPKNKTKRLTPTELFPDADNVELELVAERFDAPLGQIDKRLAVGRDREYQEPGAAVFPRSGERPAQHSGRKARFALALALSLAHVAARARGAAEKAAGALHGTGRDGNRPAPRAPEADEPVAGTASRVTLVGA